MNPDSELPCILYLLNDPPSIYLRKFHKLESHLALVIYLSHEDRKYSRSNWHLDDC